MDCKDLAEIKYVIITPVRNEEKYIEKTIQSLIVQTIKPLEWVIVDDGSTDNTVNIIKAYIHDHSWIKLKQKVDRGFRQAGTGVIEAFYDGYNYLSSNEWDYIVKLDGDLTFSNNYFERCFYIFSQNKKLGITGGTIDHIINGKRVEEKNPLFHVRGATKIYRRECWDAIGGLLMAPGWDTVDEVHANMLGWETRSLPDIRLVHLKYTGSADGPWKNAVKGGIANYIAGYHPLFLLLRCLKRITDKPYCIVSIGLLYGFIKGYIKKIPQIENKELIRYLRKEQLKRICLRKSIWK